MHHLSEYLHGVGKAVVHVWAAGAVESHRREPDCGTAARGGPAMRLFREARRGPQCVDVALMRGGDRRGAIMGEGGGYAAATNKGVDDVVVAVRHFGNDGTIECAEVCIKVPVCLFLPQSGEFATLVTVNDDCSAIVQLLLHPDSRTDITREITQNPGGNSIETAPINVLESNPSTVTLRCRFCTSRIQHTLFLRIRSLPSLYWEELSDMWFCDHPHAQSHPHETCTSSQTHHGIAARGDLLVGAMEVVIKGDCLQSCELDSTVLPPHKMNSPSNLPVALRCSACWHLLGFLFTESMREAATNLSESDIHLFPHYLTTSATQDMDENMFRKYSLETYCANFLRSTTQSHACYKYRLVDQSLTNVYSLITVMNTNMSIQANSLIPPSDPQCVFPCVKLLYQVCVPSTPQASQNIQLWSEGKVENLALMEEECVDLLHILRASTACLPPICRSSPLSASSCVGYLRLSL
ncbi:HECT-like Ubiquitin-conjugating enzyme (E2)-binding [Pelomyxa schiedti]|nr:HECT-like Ubiquitin-conjugating enzyme (E2)-binding [Pelomyxa schiedti]